MEQISYPKVWDLDKIFEGAGKSNQFLDHINRLDALVHDLEARVKNRPSFQLFGSSNWRKVVYIC